MISLKGTTRRRNRRPRTGCLGVDIGTSSIKMARADYKNGRWHIVNRLTLPMLQPIDDMSEALRGGLLGDRLSVLNNRSLTLREACRCVVPPSIVDIKTVEVPSGTDSEVRSMARELLNESQDSATASAELRLWKHSVSPHSLQAVSGILMPADLGETMVDDLAAAGLRCDSLLIQPFALTRAFQLSADAADSAAPVGLLSWENSATTLTVCQNGKPEYYRALRDCSGRRIEQRIRSAFNLETPEVLGILSTVGLRPPGDRTASTTLHDMVDSLIRPELQQLIAELQKTLIYLRHHMNRLMPQRIVMFGGMSTVPHVADAIENSLDMSVSPWSLNADNSLPTDPLFAAAIAASVGGDL